jgi:hypothetical protein
MQSSCGREATKRVAMRSFVAVTGIFGEGGRFLFDRGRPKAVNYDISLTRHVTIEMLRGIGPD